jgi:hypothetical protein
MKDIPHSGCKTLTVGIVLLHTENYFCVIVKVHSVLKELRLQKMRYTLTRRCYRILNETASTQLAQTNSKTRNP